MKNNKLVIAILIIFAFVLATMQSCKKEKDIYDENIYSEIFFDEYCGYNGGRSSSDSLIILGNILNDPYKFENMLTARNQLANERSGLLTPTISATHKYMRYKPINEEELDILKADSNLLLWDYPLHYEIAVAGTYYHDPTIVDSLPTWQYFVIPNNYQLPILSSKYELIYTLYFPEENSNNAFFDDLEERSYQLTGNLQEENMRGSKWTPSAVINVYDDVVGGYIPLQGVKVIARNFTKSKYGITDANGYCSVDGTFKTKVTYSIKWERAYWDIRDGAIGQAYTYGPKINGRWNYNISSGGKSLMFATIHRAALKFYYGNCLGVKRPILLVGKTKIAYHNKNAWWGSGCCWGTWDNSGITPNIMIAHPKSTNTSIVFATSIHELGHLSHILTLGQSLYANLKKEIHESWAAAIECCLTNQHYNSELGFYNIKCQQLDISTTYQKYWIPKNIPEKTDCYTPIFYDLIDNFNQRNGGYCGYYPYSTNYPYYYNQNIERPNDVISGYTLEFIQNNIIPSSRTLGTLNTTLKNNKINGVTDQMIDNHMAPYWNRDYSRNP